jgi:hypothetical protein
MAIEIRKSYIVAELLKIGLHDFFLKFGKMPYCALVGWCIILNAIAQMSFSSRRFFKNECLFLFKGSGK